MTDQEGIEAIKAFELLPNASQDELRRAFKPLAKTEHPDTQAPEGVDLKEFLRLSEADHIALRCIQNRALVPVAVVSDLTTRIEQTNQLLLQQQERQRRLQEQVQARSAANQIIDDVVWHTVARYKLFRQTAVSLTVFGVSLGLVTTSSF